MASPAKEVFHFAAAGLVLWVLWALWRQDGPALLNAIGTLGNQLPSTIPVNTLPGITPQATPASVLYPAGANPAVTSQLVSAAPTSDQNLLITSLNTGWGDVVGPTQ